MQALMDRPGFLNQANSAIGFNFGGRAATKISILSNLFMVVDSSDKSMYSKIESAREKARIKDCLSSISKYEKNWDGEGALNISNQVLVIADRVIEFIDSEVSISLPEVEANPNGTISMYWYWSNGRAEIEVGITTFSWVVFSMHGKTQRIYQESGENGRLLISLVKFVSSMTNERNDKFESTAHISKFIFSNDWHRLDKYR